MSLQAYTPIFLVIIVIVVVLGMPFMLANPMHHEMGCPFMSGQTAMCTASVLEHMRHWQTAFATILAELLLIATFALVAMYQWPIAGLPERSFARMRTRIRIPERPTLLQELFSNGILNRKEHYRF